MNSNGSHPPPPRGLNEKLLEREQRTVTQGLLADERRKKLILRLWRDGMSQVEIAARLSRASHAVGGEPVGEDAVNKLVKRYRHRPEYGATR